MRVLYIRSNLFGSGVPRRASQRSGGRRTLDGGGDPRGLERQSVPLRCLSQYRRGVSRGGGRCIIFHMRARPTSMARCVWWRSRERSSSREVFRASWSLIASNTLPPVILGSRRPSGRLRSASVVVRLVRRLSPLYQLCPTTWAMSSQRFKFLVMQLVVVDKERSDIVQCVR